jgi:hypothetical protein
MSDLNTNGWIKGIDLPILRPLVKGKDELQSLF